MRCKGVTFFTESTVPFQSFTNLPVSISTEMPESKKVQDFFAKWGHAIGKLWNDFNFQCQKQFRILGIFGWHDSEELLLLVKECRDLWSCLHNFVSKISMVEFFSFWWWNFSVALVYNNARGAENQNVTMMPKISTSPACKQGAWSSPSLQYLFEVVCWASAVASLLVVSTGYCPGLICSVQCELLVDFIFTADTFCFVIACLINP